MLSVNKAPSSALSTENKEKEKKKTHRIIYRHHFKNEKYKSNKSLCMLDINITNHIVLRKLVKVVLDVCRHTMFTD